MMLFIEMFTLNRAWSDLSEDEFWEPLPGSWSVRRREECRTPHPFGTGGGWSTSMAVSPEPP